LKSMPTATPHMSLWNDLLCCCIQRNIKS
jgi:hypothetical protein